MSALPFDMGDPGSFPRPPAGLNFLVFTMRMNHSSKVFTESPRGSAGTAHHGAHASAVPAKCHRQRTLGLSEPQPPDPQRPTATLSVRAPPRRAGSREKGGCEARTQGWRRLPGGRLLPPRRPALRVARRCWKPLPAGRPGTRPLTTVSSSPGGQPQARPRSAAACPPRPAPRAVPSSATAAPPHRHPGRGRTKTLSWRRWP